MRILYLLLLNISVAIRYTGNNYLRSIFNAGIGGGSIGGMILDSANKQIIVSNPGKKYLLRLSLSKIVLPINITGDALFAPGMIAGLNFSIIYLCDQQSIKKLTKIDNTHYQSKIIAGSVKSKYWSSTCIDFHSLPMISGSLVSGDGVGTNARFNLYLSAINILSNGSVLFVCDTVSNAIRRIDLANNSYVSTAFTLTSPYGTVVDKNQSYMYVSSQSQRVIYRIPLTAGFPIVPGSSMIIAGSVGVPANFVDGSAMNARFFSPQALDLDYTHSHLYIADYQKRNSISSSRLRKLDLVNSSVFTVLGGRGDDDDAS